MGKAGREVLCAINPQTKSSLSPPSAGIFIATAGAIPQMGDQVQQSSPDRGM